MTVTGPVAPAPKSAAWKKILWGIAAAFTTPEAIKAQKFVAVVALTRAAVLIPSAAFALDVLVKALGG